MAKSPAKPSTPAEMTQLIERLHTLVHRWGGRQEAAASIDDLTRYIVQMSQVGCSAEDLVMASDTGVELGAPGSVSLNAVLWTAEPGLVTDGRMTIVGKGITHVGARSDYTQLTLLQSDVGTGLDPFKAETTQYLIRRLPGVMSRAVPGKLWIRISRQAVAHGIDFALIAAALREAYRQAVEGVTAIQSVFITCSGNDADALATLVAEARANAAKLRHGFVSGDRDFSCERLNCDNCENQKVCDLIRETADLREKERSLLSRRIP
jgi:CO dehydrogenase/acetyl-CoA synthase beta subunit